MSNYITIKLRRGTQAQWAATNPVLAEGEFGAETDTRKFKIGNGVTAWNSLSYWGSAGGGAADFTDLGDVPASYTGQAGKFVKVKSTEDGLEFGTLTIAAGDLPSGIDAAKIANGTISNTEFQSLNGISGNIQTQIDGKANTVHTHNIADVTGLQSALDNRVPYVGASGDVNLGEWGAQVGNLEFDNTPTNTPATDGSVFWDSGDGTLQLQMKGGAIQKVGMNSFARVYNDSGVQLVKGDVVYISGAQGNRIAAKKAQANSESTAKNTFAIVVETIASGAEGTVITEGPLYQLNTFGLTAGATLYLSPTTAGGYTTTQPQAPDHLVIVGFVERVHATAGSIFVKISNGYELEELHDVDLTKSKTTPVDADALLLQDSADSSIWKRLTWANLKATAKSYFDTLYANIVHTHVISDVTNLQTSLDGKVDKNAAITGATKTKITYDAKGLVTAGADAAIADITGLQTALDGKVAANAGITGATKTKVTYDAKGLVTAGADATTADIADSLNKRYVTDAQLTVIGNTSGTNTGDQTITLTGDVTGSGTGSFAATIANGAVTNAKVGTGIDAAKIANGTVSNAEFETLDGVTSSIQTQINGKANTSHTHSAADITSGTLDGDRLPGLSATKRGGVPATGTPSGLFLKDDGTWATPATGGVTDGDKGDITVSGSGATWTVDSQAITLAKIQNISTSTLLGRVTAATGVTEQLTGTQATTLLDTFTSSLKGLAPASGGGTTNFLRADGTWAAPPSGGSGTVLSPAQITSWQNNYNPTSWGSGVQTLRLDGNSSFNFITGLTATTGGHRVKLMNVGSNPIGLYDANSSSTAANRFEFLGQDIILLPGRALELEYDGTSSRWRMASAYNIWAEPAEWVNYDKAELYHRNASNISAHHIGYFGSTAVEQNSGTSGIRPRNGVITSTTGTGTTGSQGFLNNHLGRRTYTFHDGTNYVGYHVFEGAIRINQLSTSSNNFIMHAGWSDQQSGVPTNGLVAQYSDNINSGNWQLMGTDNSVNTNGNSSSAVVANTWYRIRIVVYPNGTAALWVNGSLITSLSTGVPGGNRDFAPYLWIRKTSGTTAATFDADYMAVGTVYSQAR